MELNWILPAIASPMVYAAVTIGDKVILTRLRLPPSGFYLFVGITQLTIGLIILALNPWPDAPGTSLLASAAAGFMWGVALMMMFTVLRREEASRVTPVWQSSPIIAAILSVVFLDETLGWAGWLAVLLVVLGAAAVSTGGRVGRGLTLRPTFFLLLFAAAITGAAQVLLKVSSEDLSVWHNMAFRGFGLAFAMASPFLRPGPIRDLVRFLRVPRNAALLLTTETIGPFLGNAFLLAAIAAGPVSLVSALLGTRPIFVLALTVLFGLIARDLLEERLTRQDIVVKSASTAAVVGGIAIIALR